MTGFAFLTDGSVVRVNHVNELPIKDARRFVWNSNDMLQWAREFGPGAGALMEGILLKLGEHLPCPSGKGENELADMVLVALNQRVKTRSEGTVMARKEVAKAAPAAAPVKAAPAKAAAPVKAVPAKKPAPVKEPEPEVDQTAEDAEGEKAIARARINPNLIIRLVEGGTIPAREGSKRHSIMSELQDGRTTGEFIKAVAQYAGGKKDIEIAVEKGYITLEDAE